MNVRSEYPFTLSVDGQKIWCKKVKENNYEKFVTSKGKTLFVTNMKIGNAWSTVNSSKYADQLVKDSRIIQLICNGKTIEMNELFEDFISNVLKISVPIYYANFKGFCVNMVNENTNIQISEDDGIEVWKICKQSNMYKNMFEKRGNRYFIA